MSSRMTVHHTWAEALCERVSWDLGLMESVRTRYMGHGESHLIHGI